MWESIVPENIRDKYELHNFNNAVEILAQAHLAEYREIIRMLDNFSIQIEDIISPGGNESLMPKKISSILRPLDWREVKITGDLIIKLHSRAPSATTEFTIHDYIDGHNIDYVKNSVAFDMEWNSKDQTFDRDLYALRTFYECGVISCGIIMTRSESMNDIFEELGVKSKYGASTTWMGKLLPRIRSRRHGGCPLFIVGITPSVVTDWRRT
ncbi:MAG TPA: BglII/BstYI family type II restriction endonuclease [Bacillota bacterium]|nr:BglII/BstYI family type II restriction endonuclease [Bacillota bacterium]